MTTSTTQRRRRLSKKEASHTSSREASAESNDETDVALDVDDDALSLNEGPDLREIEPDFKAPKKPAGRRSQQQPSTASTLSASSSLAGSPLIKSQASVLAADKGYEAGNDSATTYDGDVSSANGTSRRAANPFGDAAIEVPGQKITHSAAHYNNIPRSRPALTSTMPSSTGVSPPSSPATASSPLAPGSDKGLLQPSAALSLGSPNSKKHPFHAPAPHGMISKITKEELNQNIKEAIAGQGPDGAVRQYKINAPPMDRPVRIYADGVYDLFHYAHALQLRQAKLCFPSVCLLVGVVSDELVLKYKNPPVLSSEERYESVRNCKWVDEVIEDAPWEVDQAFIDKHQIDYVAHDEEPYVSLDSEDVYAYSKSIGKFLPTRRTSGISTSELLSRIVEGYRYGEYDGKLAKLGHYGLMSRTGSEAGSYRSNRTQDERPEADSMNVSAHSSAPQSPEKLKVSPLSGASDLRDEEMTIAGTE